MTGLALALAVFVGTHFVLSHPLRAPLIARIGAAAFQGVYSLVAFATVGWAIWIYRGIAPQPPMWAAGDALWLFASLLMWFGSILFVGSFAGNPALPGKRLERGARPRGMLAVTRHPMMWSFALWALTHMLVMPTPKALLFDAAMLFLALVGALGQDAKKAKLMGERWHEWAAQTAFVPFARGAANPGAIALVGGTLLFFAATWAHGALGGMPAGFWRWIG